MAREQTEMIGVAILGAGQPNIATSCHLPACRLSSKVRIVALCDRLEGVREYARQYGAVVYTDYTAMLADPRVRMVQIATPDWCHCEHAEQALAAGKHVLLQKPPCISPAELERLRRAAAHAPGFLKIALNTREMRTARGIRKLIDDGTVGAVRNIRIAYRGKRFPISDLDSPYLKASLGGVWVHNGLHWLDEAFFYSGTLPSAVQAFATRNATGSPHVLGEGPNYWTALFEMGETTTFRFEYNTMLTGDGLPGGMQRWIIGTEGEIRQEYGRSDILVYTQGVDTPETVQAADSETHPADDAVESFRRLIDAFADQIDDHRERSPFLADSLLLTQALFAGMESVRTGARIIVEAGQ